MVATTKEQRQKIRAHELLERKEMLAQVSKTSFSFHLSIISLSSSLVCNRVVPYNYNFVVISDSLLIGSSTVQCFLSTHWYSPETGVQGEGEAGATVPAIQRSPDLPGLCRQTRIQAAAVEPGAGDENEKDHTTARGDGVVCHCPHALTA